MAQPKPKSIGRSGVSISSSVSPEDQANPREIHTYAKLNKLFNKIRNEYSLLHDEIRTLEQAETFLGFLKAARKEIFPSKYKLDITQLPKDVSNLVGEYRNIYLTSRQKTKILRVMGNEIVRKVEARSGVKISFTEQTNSDQKIYFSLKYGSIVIKITDTPRGQMFMWDQLNGGKTLAYNLHDAYIVVANTVKEILANMPTPNEPNEESSS
jgi:hypothetical protein